MQREKKDLIERLIKDWNSELPDLDVEAMEIVGRVIKLGKIFEKRATDELKIHDIYYTDFDVLATIRRSGPPYELTPKQLIESVLITSGAMTALLNRLTKLDLIYRSSDKTDKRVIIAGLTNKGMELVNKAIETRFKEAKISVESLSRKEKKSLSLLLTRLLISLDQ